MVNYIFQWIWHELGSLVPLLIEILFYIVLIMACIDIIQASVKLIRFNWKGIEAHKIPKRPLLRLCYSVIGDIMVVIVSLYSLCYN